MSIDVGVSQHDAKTGLLNGTVILVVDDEPTIATAIARRLIAEGSDVSTAADGLEAVMKADELQPDLIVLDLMLPGIDGLEVCRRVQAKRPVPVIMLTARDDEIDKLIGLNVGADDYMTKPFSMRELLVRIEVLLRRVARASQLAAEPQEILESMIFGDVLINRASRRVTRGEEEMHLTPTEFDLLVYMASTPGTVLSREDLLENVWNWGDMSGTRTVDSHVKALRRKLGSDLIRTVHGVGYAFEPPVEDDGEPAGRGDDGSPAK